MTVGISFEELDLSKMKCDLGGMSPESAAIKLVAFLKFVAKETGFGEPFLTEYKGRLCVEWDGPPYWAIAMSGMQRLIGSRWASLRSGVAFKNPTFGPFVSQMTERELALESARVSRWHNGGEPDTDWYFECVSEDAIYFEKH